MERRQQESGGRLIRLAGLGGEEFVDVGRQAGVDRNQQQTGGSLDVSGGSQREQVGTAAPAQLKVLIGTGEAQGLEDDGVEGADRLGATGRTGLERRGSGGEEL